MTVHFIGAGPGAADLITVRGRDLLASCPVCLYAGSIVSPELLTYCQPGTKLVDTAPMSLDEIEADYDLVIIDCPPQLGFTTMTALLTSTGLLITVVPSMLDVASMAQFLEMAGETVQTLESVAGPIDWKFLKFLIARYEPTDVPQSQMAGFLRSILLEQVLTMPMLKSTAISDAGMTQQTIYEMEPSQVVKKTLQRIMESVNGVADEFEKTIQSAWGRDPS